MDNVNKDQENEVIEITEEIIVSDEQIVNEDQESETEETAGKNSEPEIIEEEIVISQEDGEEESELVEPQYATENAAKSMQIVNLDSLIKRYLHDIEKLKEQLREYRSMMDDAFENDAEYHEQNIKIQDANKVKNGIKQRIMKQPEVALLVDKVNTIREDVKDAQEMLYGYVEQYREVSGMAQIVHDDGSIHEIIRHTKLVKKGKHRP